MMARKQIGMILAGALWAVGLTAAIGRADAVNEATKFTFSEPVEIPGQVLPAGTYWFQRMTEPVDVNVIQVYDATKTHLITTVPSLAAEQIKTPKVTEVTLTEPSATRPAALLTWFYPGDAYGQRFSYSSRDEARISEQGKFTAKANPESSHGVVLSASLR
jgi:hypothetical protein